MTRSAVFILVSLLACSGPRYLAQTDPQPGCSPLAASSEETPAISWIAAPDSADRQALDRWCAGVGPEVILTRNTESSSVDSLAVISWNTHVGGGDIPGLVRDLRAGKFTDGQPVEHFVLLLQEVYREGAAVPRNPNARAPRRIAASPPDGKRQDIVAAAKQLELNLYYVPSMANGRSSANITPEDRGNAILSTLPLTDLGAIELPYEIQRRVVVTASVTGRASSDEPWKLRVMSVHLDHRSRNERLLHSLGGGRARQARALVASLDPDQATVLGGDLNTWSLGALEGAIGVLEQHFPAPAGYTLQPTFGTASGLGGMTLDRLMFRLPEPWSAVSRRIDDRYGSDHHPLIGWVRLVNSSAASD